MQKKLVMRLVSYNLMVSLTVVFGEDVTMKAGSMATGMTTGTIGTTAMKGWYINLVYYLYKFNIWELTPTDD